MSKIKIELVEECPDCGCKVLETGQDGFIACRDCGLVVEGQVKTKKEVALPKIFSNMTME